MTYISFLLSIITTFLIFYSVFLIKQVIRKKQILRKKSIKVKIDSTDLFGKR